MQDKQTTEELINDARRGDRLAFDRVIQGIQNELGAFVISRLGPALRQRVESDDIVQETLLKAFENVERFQWKGPQSLKRWLFTIAEHMIRNASRKRSMTTGEFSIDARSKEPSPSRVMRREERLDRLGDSLGALSSDHRTVIELSRIEGLRIKEIAERMNRSPGAVKHLLSRALENLRDRFGDTESLSLPDRSYQPGGEEDD